MGTITDLKVKRNNVDIRHKLKAAYLIADSTLADATIERVVIDEDQEKPVFYIQKPESSSQLNRIAKPAGTYMTAEL